MTEMELCTTLLECCSKEIPLRCHYYLVAQHLCMTDQVYREGFERCFIQQCSINPLKGTQLHNVVRLFTHLLVKDALSWHVLAYVRLTEDATFSSLIFIELLFKELKWAIGSRNLMERLADPTLQDSLGSIFPRDNPKNACFCIKFFTSHGLYCIMENLRNYW